MSTLYPKPMKAMTHAIGARVQYTKVFLRLIAAGHCDPMWRMSGTVKAHHPRMEKDGHPYVAVDWADGFEPMWVHPGNIRSGPIANLD